MVDFDNETTITTDRTKIITVLILQRHSYVVDVLEEYFKFKAKGVNTSNPHVGSVKSGIRALFIQVKSNMDHAGNDEDVTKIEDHLKIGKLENYISAFWVIDKWLCHANLTRFIYKRDYSTKDPIAEDEAKGL